MLTYKELTTHGEYVNRVETHMSRPHIEESARETGLGHVSINLRITTTC